MPSSEEVRTLRDILVARLTVPNSRERRAIEYLLGQAIEAEEAHKPHCRIVPNDIKNNCPGEPTKDDKFGAERTLLTRLNATIDDFFDNDPDGQKQSYRVSFRNPGDAGNYFPRFSLNAQQQQISSSLDDGNYVPLFWGPYQVSGKITRIAYPEPLFYLDKHNTYLRNPEIGLVHAGSETVKTEADVLRYLRPCLAEKLEQRHSFVSAGTVKAMLAIMRGFRHGAPDRDIQATPILPDETIQGRDQNLIVLGTPSTTTMVQTLEQPAFEDPLPMQTTADGVLLFGGTRDEDVYRDRPEEHEERKTSREIVRWGVLTRRRFRNRDYIETLLAAKQGRAVQGMAEFLTDKEQMKKLVAMLPLVARPYGGREFEYCFQALFRIQMLKTKAEPIIHSTNVEKAIVFDDPKWS